MISIFLQWFRNREKKRERERLSLKAIAGTAAALQSQLEASPSLSPSGCRTGYPGLLRWGLFRFAASWVLGVWDISFHFVYMSFIWLVPTEKAQIFWFFYFTVKGNNRLMRLKGNYQNILFKNEKKYKLSCANEWIICIFHVLENSSSTNDNKQ